VLLGGIILMFISPLKKDYKQEIDYEYKYDSLLNKHLELKELHRELLDKNWRE